MKIFRDRSATKIKLAKDLLEKMNTRDRQMRSIQKVGSSVTGIKGLDKVVVEIAEAHLDSFINLIATVYAKRFSVKDLKAMLGFFDSDVGRKYTNLSSELEDDIREVAIIWNTKVFKEAEEKYKAEYLKRKAEEGIIPSDYIPPLNI